MSKGAKKNLVYDSRRTQTSSNRKAITPTKRLASKPSGSDTVPKKQKSGGKEKKKSRKSLNVATEETTSLVSTIITFVVLASTTSPV